MKKLILLFLFLLNALIFSEEMTKLNSLNVQTFTGFGVYSYSNGEKYEGQWLNGKRNGIGNYTWNNGDVYSGDWVQDKRIGKGTFTWSNGDKHYGDFINDGIRNGKGLTTWNSKNFKETVNIFSYEGDYVLNYRTGYGVAEYYNGDKYEGEWLNDIREGKGVYTYKNGDKVQGIWIYGKLDGKVKKITPQGKVYEATYKNDAIQGNWILSNETVKVENINSFDLKKYFKKNFNTRDIKEETLFHESERTNESNLVASRDGNFLFLIPSYIGSYSISYWVKIFDNLTGEEIKKISMKTEINNFSAYSTKTNKFIVPLRYSIQIYNLKDYNLEKEIKVDKEIESVSYNKDETKMIIRYGETYAFIDIATGITEKM